MELKGTKEIIFDKAIELFQDLGYENVGLRNVAAKVGIKAASIYNHFKSKEDILSSIYDYYEEHFYENRVPFENFKSVLETGSAEEITGLMFYTFESSDQKKYMRMVLITKIMYMRLFQDKRATEIFYKTNKKSCEYLMDLLQYLEDIGRLDKSFDKETFAEVFLGSVEIYAIKSFIDADYAVGQYPKEKQILSILSHILANVLKN